MGRLSAEKVRLAELDSSVASYETLLEERPYWEAREAWLEAHPMDIFDARRTESEFAEAMQHSLNQSGLTIEAQQLGALETVGDLTLVPLSFKIGGRLEPLVRWLQEVQQPGRYCEIQSFALKRAAEETSITADVKIRKLFRNQASAPSQ